MTQVPTNTGYLSNLSLQYEDGAENMMNGLKAAEEDLKNDPSNPAVLANFQAKLQEYTLFRSVQSNHLKVIKDIGAAIIQNFR